MELLQCLIYTPKESVLAWVISAANSPGTSGLKLQVAPVPLRGAGRPIPFYQRQATLTMSTDNACFVRPALAALCVTSLVALAACGGNVCVGLDGCGGASVAPNITLSGTAATGTALASAAVSFSCAQGSGSTLSDGGGHYSITFNATLPCIVTVTSGGTTLHSVAFAGGTFNTTPETELMLVYLASQLGTSETSLIAGFPSNSQFQQVLANQADVLAAQSATVTNLQQRYALTLTAPAFLTTPFVVGQAGVDSDLGALAAAGAIDANGMPDPAAVSLFSSAGLAHPLTATSTPSSSTGGAGSSTGGMM
ncbi:hypothetical protein ABH944_008502 [Caballeronia udeis]|uniref:Lipoprotein n=2 Tax=Caballeronia udeis TaxID=1232866 RepID=A0ABW8MXI9_9BURK